MNEHTLFLSNGHIHYKKRYECNQEMASQFIHEMCAMLIVYIPLLLLQRWFFYRTEIVKEEEAEEICRQHQQEVASR